MYCCVACVTEAQKRFSHGYQSAGQPGIDTVQLRYDRRVLWTEKLSVVSLTL